MTPNVIVNVVLVIVAIVVGLILVSVEGLTGLLGLPTISERLKSLAQHGGMIFILYAVFGIGLLLGHSVVPVCP